MMADTVKIYGPRGDVLREGKNLRTLLDYARKDGNNIANVETWPGALGGGMLRVSFHGGAQCLTKFESMEVLRKWCDARHKLTRCFAWPAANHYPCAPWTTVRPIRPHQRLRMPRLQFIPNPLYDSGRPWHLYNAFGESTGTHFATLAEGITYLIGKGYGFAPNAKDIAP